MHGDEGCGDLRRLDGTEPYAGDGLATKFAPIQAKSGLGALVPQSHRFHTFRTRTEVTWLYRKLSEFVDANEASATRPCNSPHSLRRESTYLNP